MRFVMVLNANEIKKLSKGELKKYINTNGGFLKMKVDNVCRVEEAISTNKINKNNVELIPEQYRGDAIYFEAIVSDSTLNMNGYKIDVNAFTQEAIDFYMTEMNGLVYYQHDMEKPIGKTIDVFVEDGMLKSAGYVFDDTYTQKEIERNLTTDISTGHITLSQEFEDNETGERLSQEEFEKIRAGKSTFEEYMKLADDYTVVVTELMFIEYSFVSVGSNTNARVTSKNGILNYMGVGHDLAEAELNFIKNKNTMQTNEMQKEEEMKEDKMEDKDKMEDMKDKEDNATDVNTGDFVSRDSSGGTAYGLVINTTTEPGEGFTPTGSDQEITAKEDDGVALIQLHDDTDDGYVARDQNVVHLFSTLTIIDNPTIVDETEDNMKKEDDEVSEDKDMEQEKYKDKEDDMKYKDENVEDEMEKKEDEKMEEEKDDNDFDREEIDEIYEQYKNTVNMTASELEAWSENDCSKEASVDRSPIRRNIALLSKNKSDRTSSDASNANRTISFISRMNGAKQGEVVEGCNLSKRDISLKNRAFDPKKNNKVIADEKSENSIETIEGKTQINALLEKVEQATTMIEKLVEQNSILQQKVDEAEKISHNMKVAYKEEKKTPKSDLQLQLEQAKAKFM